MNDLSPAGHDRLAAMRPFVAVAVVAIVTGGLVAAAIAHAPTRPLVWMVAYLVLVAGVVQAALGIGQAWLPARLPPTRFLFAECALFNLGNVGVIAGTLLGSSAWVAVGTVLFVASLAMLLYGVRRARGGWPLHAYRGVLAVAGCGALVGLVLSLVGSAG